MQRIYVSTTYLKTLHYLFFSFAVFSLAAGIMFFSFALIESLSFFGLSIFYCITSLIVAYHFYKNYREIIEPFRVIRLYLPPYLILVVWTIGTMAFLVWVFPSITGLIYSFLFINYYMFFVVIIGFAVSRFRIVSRFFEFYNLYVLGKAKSLAKRHALFLDISEYETGSDSMIDELLDEAWAHKAYPLPYVRRLETALCEKHIIDINRMISKMKDDTAVKDKDVIESLEKMKEDYLKKIREIEQKID
jgi:hypothetical protein